MANKNRQIENVEELQSSPVAHDDGDIGVGPSVDVDNGPTAPTETTNVQVDKSSVSVAVESSVTVNISGDTATWTAESNPSSKVEATVAGNVLTIKGLVTGDCNVTVKGTADGKLEGSIVIPVSVTAKIVPATPLEADKETVSVKVGETVSVTMTTTANTITAKADKERIKAEVSGKTITISGISECSGFVTVEAQAADSEKATKQIAVTILPKETVAPSTNDTAGINKIPKQSEVSKAFVANFTGYTNSANLTLSRVVKVTCWDCTLSGRFVKNYVFKQLITDMIREKVGQVKFHNEAYAKSAIKMIADLTKADYGIEVTDIQKDRLIRKVLNGNGIKY